MNSSMHENACGWVAITQLGKPLSLHLHYLVEKESFLMQIVNSEIISEMEKYSVPVARVN